MTEYDEAHEEFERALRRLQEAWAKDNGLTEGSLVTDWQISTNARNINEKGQAITQSMILGSGGNETILGLCRLSTMWWENETVKTYKWNEQ